MLRIINKTGAMFGLDARIALAIFGALSVISGAALYSAIQNSKATALLSEMQEIGKAWEQYYLDTGESLPRTFSDNSNAHYYVYRTIFLKKDHGLNGWRGPYLDNDTDGNYVLHKDYFQIRLVELRSDTGWADDWTGGGCSSGLTCSLWISLSGINDLSMLKSLDKLIDGQSNHDEGNFRYDTTSISTDPYYSAAYFKYSAISNPND